MLQLIWNCLRPARVLYSIRALILNGGPAHTCPLSPSVSDAWLKLEATVWKQVKQIE